MSKSRLETLREFVAKDESDSFSRYGLAMELTWQSLFAEAEKQFLELRQRDANYVPLYYQFAKLYESMEKRDQAVVIYEEGMAVARRKGDMHAVSELEAALEELRETMESR